MPPQPGRDSFYPLIGRRSTGGAFERIPVQELQAQYPYQWTLFILGFAWIKNDPIPFAGVVPPELKPAITLMDIGGIHGRPYREWAGHGISADEAQLHLAEDNDKNPTCLTPLSSHSVIGFPSWHRPYVMLIEQAIGEYADSVAQQIEDKYPEEVGLWIDAAKKLRFPYWDWAGYHVTDDGFRGFPSLFYEDPMSVMGLGKEFVNVPNPLSYYKFRRIPGDFKVMERGMAKANFPEWQQTYRHAGVIPSDPPQTNIAALDRELKAQVEDLRAKVKMLFSFPSDGDSSSIYDHFASVAPLSDEGKKMVNGSLEGVHNSVHGLIGGNGHMGQPEYAAFDPFFYFHHANVDRLFALWEWCYPNYWMNEGYVKDGKHEKWTQPTGMYFQTYNGKQLPGGGSGPLIPWRHDDEKGTYWTSDETRFLTSDVHPKCNAPFRPDLSLISCFTSDYTYKEFLGIKVDKPAASLQEREAARKRISDFYDDIDSAHTAKVSIEGVGAVSLPAHFRAIRAFHLFIIDVKLPHRAFGRTYELRVFYTQTVQKKGFPDEYKEVLIGNVNVFATENDAPCEGCISRRDTASITHGVIYISPRIVSEIIVRTVTDRSKNNIETTARLVSEALHGKLWDVCGYELASAKGGAGAPAIPADQAADEKFHPVEVTLKSAAVVHDDDDKAKPAHLGEWTSHGGLFPVRRSYYLFSSTVADLVSYRPAGRLNAMKCVPKCTPLMCMWNGRVLYFQRVSRTAM
ncbi:Di-copper centre-containing protein [Paxillus ammoniavirescens]|nr:Di-copper centre-containing protein [Paxillus ammoniavirescens]